MEGISKSCLEDKLLQAKKYNDVHFGELLEYLISECKELPAPQWQTIDEFKANPVEGWLWIKLSEKIGGNDAEMAFYNEDGYFYENIDCNSNFIVNYITHVMPIQTPEAPK